MKRWILGLFLGVCLLFIPTVAHAEDYLSEFQALLPEGMSLPEEGEAGSVGIEAFFHEILSILSGNRGEIGAFLLFCLGITFLSSVGGILPEGVSDFVRFGIDTVCVSLLFLKLSGLLGEVTSALCDASALFRGMIPILTAIHAAGGGVMSAGSATLSSALVFEAINTLTVSILPPLIGGLFSLGLFSVVAPKSPVTSLSKSMKNAGVKIMGWLTLFFSFALGIQTALGTAGDSLSLRAAKYAVSSAIPIVGNTVSASLGTLLSSLSYMKTIVGIYGVFALALTILPVLLRLLFYRLILGFCQWLGTFFGGQSRAVEAMTAPIELLGATVAFSSLLLLLETALCVMSGVRV